MITSIILGIIILFFIISVIHHQRRSHALYKQSIEAEITTLEKERGRMAADLHDELGPLLSAIKFRVGSLDLASEEDNQTVDRVNDHIDTLVRRMREISNDLMPNILVHKGLVAALNDYIENLARPETLQIQFAHADVPALQKEKEIHIYRIVQEIIHNTIKHAQASLLQIELKKDNEQLVLHSRDNGVGFDYNSKTRQRGHLGLQNLLSRSEMLNASFFAESAREKGTSYIFEIPLQPT